MTSYEDFEMLMKKSDKGFHHGYHRFYYPLLKEYEFEPVRFLEIGVDDGKSMVIWKQFFKNANHIYGIGYKNYQTKYKEVVDDNMTLFMGDQSNVQFLNKMKQDTGGNFDIIVDDGSHVPSHIKVSFENLWPVLKPGGMYIIEDIETSYWNKHATIYGYSFTNEESIVEYFKQRVDDINNEFRNKPSTDMATITFAPNMIIIQKTSHHDVPYMNRNYRFKNFL